MRWFMKAALALTVLGTMATGVASAEVSDVRELNVPFAFEVNGKAMAAGHYRLERSTNPSVILLRNQTGEGIFVTTEAPDVELWAESPAITFTRNNKGYELTSIAGTAIAPAK